METLLYLETNIIAIVVLIIVLVKGKLNSEKRTQDIAFVRVVWLSVASLFFDCICALACGRPGKVFRAAAMCSYAVHFSTAAAALYEWLIFTCHRIERDEFSKKAQITLAVPFVIITVLFVASVFTQWMFVFDSSNIPERGLMHLLFVATIIWYVILIEKYAIKAYTDASALRTKSRALTVIIVSFFPLAAAVATVFIDFMPLITPALALSILAVYIDSKNHQISTDALTGLNNRAQFDKYIAELDENRKENTCLILADVDKFKSINDTYGHLEGDKALKSVAKVLKEICGRSNAFMARYGGDEFVIVFQWKNPSAIYRLMDNLIVGFEEFNKTSGLPYRIEVSFGYAKCEKDSNETPMQLVKRADENMYTEKMARKARG